jgi:ribonuclease HI
MIINTRNKAYAPKGKFDPPRSSSSPSSFSTTAAAPKVPKIHESQRITPPLPSSKYNILNQLANIKADATLIDMVVIPKQHMHLKQLMEGKASVVANLSKEANEEDYSINKAGVDNFIYLVKKKPFYISVKIMDKIAHYCLIDGGSGSSVVSKIIMEELGLSCTNENARIMLSYNSIQQTTIGDIKDVTLVLGAHSEIRTTLNIQVIDMPVSNYSIILGRYWQALTGGYLSLDETHLSIPRNGNNIIVLREGRISPYIESVPQSSVNYIEEDLGVYSIFVEEDNIPLEKIDLDDHIWRMHFDGSCSSEGNGAGIILVSPMGKNHNLSYRLEFSCSNNGVEFEALLLGIENALNLGCGHLSFFGNYDLVVNLIRKTCSPSDKLMEQYSQTVWALVSNLLSFNITHIKRELNSIVDRLVVFVASPTQQLLPHWPDCAFQYLHRPYIAGNEEFWKAIPNDESICVVIQHEPLKPE